MAKNGGEIARFTNNSEIYIKTLLSIDSFNKITGSKYTLDTSLVIEPIDLDSGLLSEEEVNELIKTGYFKKIGHYLVENRNGNSYLWQLEHDENALDKNLNK